MFVLYRFVKLLQIKINKYNFPADLVYLIIVLLEEKISFFSLPSIQLIKKGNLLKISS